MSNDYRSFIIHKDLHFRIKEIAAKYQIKLSDAYQMIIQMGIKSFDSLNIGPNDEKK